MNNQKALALSLQYAAQGIKVFACTHDKKPATPNGFKDAHRHRGA
jgi:hypothetical protein